MCTPRETLLLAANSNDQSDLIRILQDQGIYKCKNAARDMHHDQAYKLCRDSEQNKSARKNANNPSINLAEIFMELSQKQNKMFCEKLKGLIKNVMLVIAPSIDTSKENCELLDITREVAIQVLMGVTSVISTIIQNEKILAENVFAVSIILHDAIDCLPRDANILKNRISQMCEIWWCRDIYNRDRIIPKAFTYLLRKSLEKPTNVDIKRVNALKNCLITIHLDEDENEMLVKCATSSAYLQTEHGKRFIAFIMVLSPRHVKFFHNAIVVKLTQCSKKEPAHYGEIYRRAWYSTCGNNLKEVLELCIQDIMDHCIHASSIKLFKVLKMFLDQLHCPKLHMEFHQMIARLYAPILWRSLKVANHHVRRNAATLFFAAFPFEAESLVQVEKETQIQKHLILAEELIYDTHPSVRASAALGVCNMFCVYWRLIPNTVLRSILKNLVDDLAFDATSWLVRVNVFKGFAVLLKNPLMFELLKDILPLVGKCLHDIVEHVRVAFLECLLLLKGVKIIKFWQVVSPDELICRLAADSSAVCARITKLLLPTYLPFNKGNTKLVNRIITLIMTNREASRRFFMYAFTRTALDLTNAVDFIVLVHRLVFEYAKTKLKKTEDNNEDMMLDSMENIDLDDANEEVLEELDLSMDVIGGLLDSVSIVLFSINKELSKGPNKPLKKKIHLRLSRSMPKLFQVFRETEVFDSVLYLSSLIPASTVQMASSYCMSRLRALMPSSTSDEYIILLESMTNWSRADEVLELISGWLSFGLATAPTPSRKVIPKRAVNFQEPVLPQPEVALDLISALMKSTLAMTTLIRNNRADLLELFNQLKQVLNVFGIRFAGKAVQQSDEFLVRSFLLLCEIAILCDTEQAPVNRICLFSQILEWVESDAFPRLHVHSLPLASEDNEFSFYRSHVYDINVKESSTLPWRIIMSAISASCNIMAVLTVDITVAARIANLCGLILSADVPCQSSEGGQMLLQILYTIHQLEVYHSYRKLESGAISHETVPRLFSLWLKAMLAFTNHFEDNKDDVKRLLSDLKPSLEIFLLTCQKKASTNLPFMDAVMSTLMAFVLSNVTSSFIKVDTAVQENGAYCLPQLSTLLLSTVCLNTDVASHFVKELTTCIQTQVIVDHFGLFAAVAILFAVEKDKVPAVEVKKGILVLEEVFLESYRKISNSPSDTKAVWGPRKREEFQEALQNLKKAYNLVL